ncbi:MAG: prepilin peptidase [Clostridiales bacterium]|nr:prepilin peptidase [Clostridiales bacterium]
MGICVFIIGALLGSFYLVIGSRLLLNENVITGRSRCDHCKTNLRWYELIPLISYVMQLGKCRTCKKKISSLHIIMELATGILFLVGYLYYGIDLKLGIYLVIISVALIIFVSDFKYMIILDSPLIIGSILIIVLRYFEIGLKNTIYSCIYGIILFLVMYLIKIIGDKMYKRESLGGGDIKLCFLIGLTLGYPGIGFRLSLISLIFAAFLALPYAMLSVYLNKKNELPFGPFLISSMIIMFVFIDKFKNLLLLFMI